MLNVFSYYNVHKYLDNVPSKSKKPQKPYNTNPEYNKRPKCPECGHRGNVSDETHECEIHGSRENVRTGEE